MKEREVFKIDQDEPEGFNFRQTANKWLKRPWYLMIVVLIGLLVGAGIIYYSVDQTGKKVITENYSPQPTAFDSEVSGVSMMDESRNSKKDLVNILLLGNGGANHPGGALTDVIQLLSINTQTNKGLIFSIPRDLYVNVNGFGYHKINTAYNLGESSGHGQGGALAKKEIEQLLEVPVHYYIKIDFTGFVKLVDLLDGVEVCVEKPINDSQHGTYISTGCQQMNGSQTLAFVRSRYTTSDFDRSRRQQKVLMAIKDKALDLNFLLNPLKLKQALNILVGNLNTDIKIEEIKQIANVISNLDRSNLKSYVLDNRKDNLLYSTIKNGAYVLLPVGGNFAKIRKFVDKKLPINEKNKK